ncbi:AAA family ATPase [Hydrogenoanaerobacterium sp.]|uniref:AAA family ATPase n=1 Tax=Hydrogenoanaerobacterium sp. TaxID=2953763 RepID=UPI0028A0747D|nr:AAA family ATPase [Hydrogenoanaerobacterium sp.]
MSIRDLSSDDSYISDLPVVKNLIKIRKLNFNKRVTFFVGENGTGKSTLLEAIAVKYGFNAEGGTINFSFSSNATHSSLSDYLFLTKAAKRPRDGFFLRAESFYNVASYIDELDKQKAASSPIIRSYGGVSLHEQSHGESFLSLVQNRFGGNGLYILDEPEAALSPSRQMTLLVHIRNLVKNNSQFIIATHSPILLSFPGADIFELTEDDIKQTEYQKTEHYILTKQFLNKPEQMLKYLFED